MRFKLSRGSTRVCEDGSSVAVSVRVDDFQCVIESVGFDYAESRTEDLLPDLSALSRPLQNALVRLHGGGNVKDGGADKVAVFIARNGGVATVQQYLAALLLNRRDQRLDALLCLRRDDWSTALSASVEIRNHDTYRSVPSSKPPETRSALARSMSSGIHSREGPTKMAELSGVALSRTC